MFKFDFLKKYFAPIQPQTKVLILATVLLFGVSHYALTIYEFTENHIQIAQQLLYTTMKNEFCHGTESFIFEHDVAITNHINDKKYEINSNNSTCKEVTVFTNEETTHITGITIKNNDGVKVIAQLPTHFSYYFKNGIVSIHSSHYSDAEFMSVGLFVIFASVLLLIIRISEKKTNKTITELKLSTQESLMAEKSISAFSSMIHHKLNTPMKVISTSARILTEIIDNLYKLQQVVDASILAKAEEKFRALDNAIKEINSKITNNLKEYENIDRTNTNIYDCCVNANTAVQLFTDDDFKLIVDYQTKKYEIDTTYVKSEVLTETFYNLIKFSLSSQLANTIYFKIFKASDDSISILYTDNGNILDQKKLQFINDKIYVVDMINHDFEQNFIALLATFNLLNANVQSKLKLISSNSNGNLFLIKIPVTKNKAFASNFLETEGTNTKI